MFYIKGGYVQATLAFLLLGGWVIALSYYLANKYDVLLEGTPLALLEAAPRVTLHKDCFTPPPLRAGAKGWFPEYGKAWQYWGVKRYGF